ncbi:MAG: sigma-70 family RNA polymerase sigma factor [Myxococcales bacterium]|nr:sigma-70 family RNA polymerase sigma factor [Myxococcales bacterium]
MAEEKARPERQRGRRALSAGERALVANATPLARALARRFVRRARHLEPGELESVASEALVHAALRFDPSLGIPFAVFAYKRVRGELLNAVVSEASRRRGLTSLLRLDPEEDPPPAGAWHGALEDSPEEARRRAAGWLAGAAASLVAGALLAEPPPRADEELAARQEAAHAHRALERALAALDDDQARFLELYYRRGLTLDEAARELGVAKRTVQRWHEAAKVVLARELVRIAREGEPHGGRAQP